MKFGVIELWRETFNEESGQLEDKKYKTFHVPPYELAKPPRLVEYNGQYYVWRRQLEYSLSEVLKVEDPPPKPSEATSDIWALLKGTTGEHS